jgi:predicted transcriptional regulator
MSKRNTDDAEVQNVVRWIKYISQEVDLIKKTKTWSEADFLYAIERLEVDLPKEMRDQVRGLYRNLLMERQATDARIVAEEASARRHDEISRRLEELKKPHWSIVPNFWMTAAILILTAIGVIAAFLALRH